MVKTISMRIRGVTDEGEELAEDMLPKMEAAFASIGMTLKEDENTFKSTIQILREVAAAWDKIIVPIFSNEYRKLLKLLESPKAFLPQHS